MKHLRLHLLLFVALLAPPLFAQAGVDGLGKLEEGILGLKAEKEHARAELIADVTAIEPGKPFRLGVRYTMDPKWHIYWINYGDSGQTTKIKWQLPEGFEAGPLQWPAPERSEYSGLVTYVYSNEVVLFAEVTPPADLQGDTVNLAAHSDWLVCDIGCIPGQADVALALPVGKAERSPNAEKFDHFAARVPKELAANQAPESADLPVKVELQGEPFNVTPGAEAPTSFTVRAIAPWTIDKTATEHDAPGLFPLVADDWISRNPVRTKLDDESMAYDWSLEARLEAKENPEAVKAVIRLPLINNQTGEKRIVALVRPVQVKLSAAAASQGGQPAAEATGATQPPTPQFPRSIFYYLFLAFIGGIILNIMPCVLPVLSLKVLSLVRQAGENHARIFTMGLVYAAGVLVSFGALAGLVVATKLAGGNPEWGTYFQEPRFVIVVALIILALALSLFNVYIIELPGSAATKLDALAGREGYAGSFLNGLLATVLATPCMAPFLGTAVGYAFSMPPAGVVSVFLAIGAGLAFPFVLLTAVPSWLRFLPRPGAWMETFKQFMGFLLIGSLVWLFTVLGGQIGVAGITWTLALMFAVSMACWVIGQTTGRGGVRAVIALAILAVGAAVYPWNSIETWQREVAEAQALRVAASEKVDVAQIAPTTPEGEINWTPFTVNNRNRLLDSGRIVFVDFTADWCVTCKFNEKGTLATDRVAELFKQHNVASLKADWTNKNEEIGAILRQLGQTGVPAYVFYDPKNPAQPVQLPTLLNASAIEEGLASVAGGTNVAMKQSM